MSSRKRPNRIKKGDYSRVLVTETVPYETPIIFSNDGLYERIVEIHSADPIQQMLLRALVFGEGEGKTHSSIPYLYKIRKGSRQFRRLALIHPRSQWKVKEFYEKYENLLLYHCAHSPASIRAPHKVAGSFFFKGSMENLNQYRDGSISRLSLDELTKHNPSFFSYRGYNRLYKFFESKDFFELEKQYGFMLSLDVSKCFDSIYTHTLSWAVKDKEFTKKYVSIKTTFAQEFDALMQHANRGETNGIVIGPEVSRLFAEIIFQEIDVKTILHLKKKNNFDFGKDYVFRRYVDDIFIFAETSEHAQIVYEIYADILLSFNLHANVEKSIALTRPFVTSKSRLIHAVSAEVNDFIGKFLEAGDDVEVLIPYRIRSVWKLTRSFIESIKSLCSYNQVNYDEVASYLISVLTERIKKIVAIKTINQPDNKQKDYRDALFVLLDVLYFLYEVSPSVGASYKHCISIILIIRFTKKHLPMIESTVVHRIYELTESLLLRHQSNSQKTIDGFIPLELLNVMLAIRELGKDYLIPESNLQALFPNAPEEHSYFSITSCLFYIRDEQCYATLKKMIISAADKKLSNLSDIRVNSEKTYLLLDLLSCPYIPEKKKKSWLNAAFKGLGMAKRQDSDIEVFLHAAISNHIQVNWSKKVDLLSSLEKKELKQAY